MTTGVRYIPPAIPGPLNDAFSQQNDPHGVLKKEYQVKCKTRVEQMNRDEHSMPMIFMEIVSTWSRESEEMIKQDPDYEAAERARDPILLLPIWRKTHRQPMSGAVVINADTALSRYYNLTQSNKSLPMHKKDFDDAVDILVASGEQKPTDEKLAARFLASLDPNRYAQWRVDLENDTKAGLDVIPKTLPEAYTRAFNLKKVGQTSQQPVADASVFVAKHEKKGRSVKRESKKESKSESKTDDRKPPAEPKKHKRYICKICKSEDHQIWDCPHLEQCQDYVKSKMSGTDMPYGGIDGVHISCGKTLNPTDFVVLPVMTTASPQAIANDDMIGNGEAIALPAVDDNQLDDWYLLLDTEATIPVVKNSELLDNIRPADVPVRVDGIGGSMIIDQQGDLPDFGTVYHDPNALANVVSFAMVEDAGTIKYIQGMSTFDVHISGKHYSFSRLRTGRGRNLYACDLRQHSHGRFGVVCVTTVTENEALFTKREVGDARKARDLSRRLGYPSLQHLIKIVKKMEN